MHQCGSTSEQVQGVFGLPGPIEGHREERLHLEGSAGVPCGSFEACTATSRDVMKMEHAIVMHMVGVL